MQKVNAIPQPSMAFKIYRFLWYLWPVLVPILSVFHSVTKRRPLTVFAHLTDSIAWRSYNQSDVWICCASMGEVRMTQPLLKELKSQLQCHFTVTAHTIAGYLELERQYAQDPQVNYYQSPMDGPGMCSRFLNGVKPKMVVFTESELRPLMLYECRRRSIPTVLCSARVSIKSKGILKKLGGWRKSLMISCLKMFDSILAVTREDAQLYEQAGVSKTIISVIPSLKYAINADATISEKLQEIEASSYADQWEALKSQKLFIAGSVTLKEVEVFSEAWHTQPAKVRKACLPVLVPRQANDFQEATELCRTAGLKVGVFSDSGLANAATKVASKSSIDAKTLSPEEKCDWGFCDIFILDAYGWLTTFFSIGDCAFIGDSLFPQGKGHNLVEPAMAGLRVAIGPHHSLFVDLVRHLQEMGMAEVVKDVAQLIEFVFSEMTNVSEAKMIARKEQNEKVIRPLGKQAISETANNILKVMKKSTA